MQQTETQSIEWTVSTDEESRWLVTLGELWQARTQTGWQFVTELRDGIDKFSKRRDRAQLYELVANQTGLAIKTLMNYVSLSRNPNSAMARELGLDIAHAEAVLGLEYDEAQALLTQAAETSLSANAIGAIVRESRQARTASPVPAVGNETNQRSINDDMHDVPFDTSKPNVLYDDDYDTEADNLAGSATAYDYGDDEDGYTYTGPEMLSLIQRATNRLRDTPMWDEQRTVNEWLAMLARHTY
ncbi:MAG TPA: hypothetical protein VLA24_09405 [Pseudomonadales bacterium]|nr:hypothetical protein [Pseudomonadales bacterium]